jgi:peptidoglycan L-alanyl-D-glutamate endopeptidase CwlK
MSFILSQKSLRRLEGVNPALVQVVRRAIQITPIDFIVVEGLRTKERQAYLVEKGASKTMNSRHLTGDAVDLAPIVDNKVSWDWKHFYPLAEAVKQAAKELRTEVRWGGTWKKLSETEFANGKTELSKTFPDGPHFEIGRPL